MRHFLLLPLLILLPLASYAWVKASILYTIDSVVVDKTLSSQRASCHLTMNGLPQDATAHRLDYGVDKAVYNALIKPDRTMLLKTTAGLHTFHFKYTDDLQEISIFDLKLKGSTITYISLHFTPSSSQQIIDYKPVIYIYPESTQQVIVSVQPVGHSAFYYPVNDGNWQVEAHPNGELVTVDGQRYRYLFWEATEPADQNLRPEEGFLVSGKHATGFLDSVLRGVGFNARERTDFITFWAPRLQKNEWNFIHFVSNATCDRFATLQVSPEPDETFRFFIQWCPTTQGPNPKAQKLPVYQRKGYTVLEWGGQEHPFQELNSQL